MSYVKSYNDKVKGTVEIPYGTGKKAITVELPVQVNIHVNTEPFDTSVNECERNLNMLTTALTDTERAELEAKEISSERVAESIINGFFGYIRSEISQQANELLKIVESRLIVMRELMKASKSKKVQMESDFKRISNRYCKIFDDLNRELSNRIFNIDKQAFDFRNETNTYKVRAFNNDLVSTISVFGAENSELLSKLSSSVTKKRVYDTINLSKMFLLEQKRLEQSLDDNIMGENFSGVLLSPVCYIEASKNRIQIDKKIVAQQFVESHEAQFSENNLIERFSSNLLKWKSVEEDERKKLQIYFDTEFAKRFNTTNGHDIRIKENIRRLSDLSSINVTL